MFANKLRQNKPRFAAVRGAVAWVVLMGVWFLYPHLQSSHYRPDAGVNTAAEDSSFMVANEEAPVVAPELKQPATILGQASFEPAVTGELANF